MGICGKELKFDVVDATGNSQESLKKVHSGCYRECCTAADNYEFTLPQDDLDGALFITAVQFLDMLFFENPWGCCMP